MNTGIERSFLPVDFGSAEKLRKNAEKPQLSCGNFPCMKVKTLWGSICLQEAGGGYTPNSPSQLYLSFSLLVFH